MKKFLVSSLNCSDFDALLIIAFVGICVSLFVFALIYEVWRKKLLSFVSEKQFCEIAFWPVFVPLVVAAFGFSVITFANDQETIIVMFIFLVIVGAWLAKLLCVLILWLAKQTILAMESLVLKLKSFLHFQGGR